MTRILFFSLASFLLLPALYAQNRKTKPGKKPVAAVVEESKEIRWMTIDEAQVAMKKEPRKVFMDVYTDWCGWCKVMDKKTFSHPEVIRYINKNFYAVKLNAEQKDPIRFNGSMYNFMEQYRANQFAVDMMQGRMSYPTSVIMEENFQNPQPVPGYLDVPTIEMVLKYLGENVYKTKQFAEWQQGFKASWAAAQ